MFSLLKFRKTLLTATFLLLTCATQPALAFLCLENPNFTPDECRQQCKMFILAGTFVYAMCY